MSKNKRFVWAFDPFTNGKLNETTVKAIQGFAPEGSEIVPVHILAASLAGLSEGLDSVSVEECREATLKAMRKFLEEKKGFSEPEVLIERTSGSIRQSVQRLTDFCDQQEIDLVFLGTHAREGLDRFFLGSFAETFLIHSKTPSLIVNPESDFLGRVKTIIYPSDFGDASLTVFPKVVKLAKDKGAKIRVYHKVHHPAEPIIQSSALCIGGTYLPVNKLAAQQVKYMETKALELVQFARKEGVEAEFEVDPVFGNAVDIILERARENEGSIIAMASQSGQLASALVGSMTRQVVRRADCPVWTLHSE